MKKKNILALIMLFIFFTATIGTAIHFTQGTPVPILPSVVNLGSAENFVILGKSGITNVPTSSITGNMGVSPIAASSITGFALVMDSTNTFATSSQVVGRVYASDYAIPTPALMTTAITAMTNAYVDASTRTPATYTNLGAGTLGAGTILTYGIYKWTTDLSITGDITFTGDANSVFIMQISGNLVTSSASHILLNGVDPDHIFWQVAGHTELGTDSYFNGIILDFDYIALDTRAQLNGAAYSQKSVTLDHNIIGRCGQETVPPIDTTSGYVTLTVLKYACKPVAEFGVDFGDILPDVGNYSVLAGTNMTFNAINRDVYGIPFALMNWNYNGTDMYDIPFSGTNVTITVNGNSTLYAMFNPHTYVPVVIPPPIIIPPPPQETNETYILHISKFTCNGVTENFGSVSPNVGDYVVPAGTNVTVVATPYPDWQFNSWEALDSTGIWHQVYGGTGYNINVITITVNSNLDLEAEFNPLH